MIMKQEKQVAVKSTVKKTQVKAVTKKETEKTQNEYILACNNLTHKAISQDFSGVKATKKQKEELKALYEEFKRKTVNLNTLYARHIYQKLQKIFKTTDIAAIIFYLEEKAETEEQIEYQMCHDYFVEHGVGEDGTKLYSNQINNETVDKFFTEIDEELKEAINEISLQFLDEEDYDLILIKDMTFEDFLETLNLTIPISHEIELNFSEFEEVIA